MRRMRFLPTRKSAAVPATLFFVLLGHAPECRASEAQRLEELVRQWVTLRREVIQVDKRWEEQRTLLEGELRLLKRRKERLQQKIEQQRTKNAKLSAHNTAAVAEREKYQAVLNRMSQPLAQAEAHLRSWRERLPAFMYLPLAKSFEKLTSTVTDESAATQQGERLQRVFGLYSKLEQLNAGIHAEKLIVPGPGKKEREMDALFFGLAAGFAVATDNTDAAVGRISSAGVTWEWKPELADALRTAWQRYHKEKPPGFVRLPMRIEETGQ
jgi:hypothetical protein